ncbi:MAG TPA: septal ring lytic transglycosylase RlpA family protein [Ferruginibacter sp.]|nr:septal ring lytic transglycosylase RlpA family protein [Ferruginibacter sp.]
MIKFIHIKAAAILLFGLLVLPLADISQTVKKTTVIKSENKKTVTRILYGQASYYASKFEGRKTATGEKFGHGNLTAACNVLPLGTWIKVTNLRNGKSIVVRTNDRLHPKTKRIVDLSKTGAQKLGYIKSGLTRVKIEVLPKKTK